MPEEEEAEEKKADPGPGVRPLDQGVEKGHAEEGEEGMGEDLPRKGQVEEAKEGVEVIEAEEGPGEARHLPLHEEVDAGEEGEGHEGEPQKPMQGGHPEEGRGEALEGVARAADRTTRRPKPIWVQPTTRAGTGGRKRVRLP